MARTRAEGRDPSRVIHEVEAIVCAAIGCGLALSFVSYIPESPAINRVGPWGYAAANLLIQCFGYAAYIFPTFLIVAGITLFARREARVSPVRVVGGVFLLLLSSVALGLYRSHVNAESAGGWIGGFLAELLEQSVGRGGSTVALIASALLVFMMVTGRTVSDVALGVAAALRSAVEKVRVKSREAWAATVDFSGTRLPDLRFWRGRAKAAAARRRESLSEDEPPVIIPPEPDSEPGEAEPSMMRRGLAGLTESARSRRSKKNAEPELEPDQEEFVFDMDTSDFRLPPGNLLGDRDERADYGNDKTLVSQSKILEQKLATFGVDGKVTAVRPGPVITTYEFEPEAGVKLSRVVNLCDDLTMALRAHGVRIVAPIPGKNCVGIEVANRERQIVGIRDLIDSKEFRGSKATLPLAIGRDTTGTAVYADLAKMPHLLMAGATGTGKSVSLNALIVSLLYRATPREVRFILIDPKMLELSLYDNIPHLLVPVVTDVKKAAAALANVMREMERRFEMLKEKRVRSLDDYNRKLAEEERNKPAVELKPEPMVFDDEDDDDELEEGERAIVQPPAVTEPPKLVHEHLPRIVVVVDELADLMMTVGREVEESITRLAQKARAAGIHLILATQRPSVDVITGLIKANFPSRISFQVTARPDSRTILDSIGAERLLGNGDLLYMAPTTSFLQRLHGGYVTDSQVQEVVDYLRKQGDPDYKMDMLENPLGGDEDGEEAEFFDELYDRAVDLVTKHGQGSTSWLQRKLGIGYNRSARIMEHMEREGVVGPGDGSRPRQVLAQAIEH